MVAPAEKLTWDEIKARYPDSYVLLVDREIGAATTVTAGNVVKVGTDKAQMHRSLLRLKAKHTALLWTGVVQGLVRFTPVEVEE